MPSPSKSASAIERSAPAVGLTVSISSEPTAKPSPCRSRTCSVPGSLTDTPRANATKSGEAFASSVPVTRSFAMKLSSNSTGSLNANGFFAARNRRKRVVPLSSAVRRSSRPSASKSATLASTPFRTGAPANVPSPRPSRKPVTPPDAGVGA